MSGVDNVRVQISLPHEDSPQTRQRHYRGVVSRWTLAKGNVILHKIGRDIGGSILNR
jgi:hypothetical protein